MPDETLISVRDHGPVRELSLARPPVNAIHPGLMRALRSGLREAREAGCQAIVSEIPIAVALTGHSPAGGAVLAICADYRVLADGPYFMGLNEVEVGLPVPEVIYRVLAHVVGQRTAERLAVTGALLGPAEALRYGLVDELAPVAEVVPRALAWLGGLLGRAPDAVAATRRLARQPLFDAFATVDGALIEKMLEAWFSPETQAAARALVARLAQERRRDKVGA